MNIIKNLDNRTQYSLIERYSVNDVPNAIRIVIVVVPTIKITELTAILVKFLLDDLVVFSFRYRGFQKVVDIHRLYQ